ncbi:MAG TPA: hypothetical protein VFQ37_16720, partial [Mycobacterium sp.]|nr:hypothetical protein [Mycobacterium sp.]
MIRRHRRGIAALLLQVLVCVLLVPAMILSSTGAAEAAVVHGSALHYGFSWGFGAINGWDCSGSAQWTRTGTEYGSVDYNGRCKSEVPIDVGPTGPDEGSYVRVEFTGLGGANGSCDLSGQVAIQGDGSADYSGSAGGSGWEDCNVTQMCMTVHDVVNNFRDSNFGRQCIDFALGLPPAAAGAVDTGTCPQHGEALSGISGKWVHSDWPNSGGGENHSDAFVITVNGELTSSARLAMAMVFRKSDGTIGTKGFQYPPGYSAGFPASYQPYYESVADWQGGTLPPRPDVIGIQVYDYDWASQHSAAGTPDGQSILDLQQRFPNVPPNGTLGLTHGSLCEWYVGEKIANTTDDYDEPMSGLDLGDGIGDPLPPVSDPEARAADGCNFSLSDPSTWASSGMCAAVGLLARIFDVLGSIFGAIAGIPAAIVNGIGNLLSSLFVPSQAAMDSAQETVKDSVGDTDGGETSQAATGPSPRRTAAAIPTGPNPQRADTV